ncbi:MAG: hypothetical protein ACLFNU_09740 [Bacteroidales bacterium]
MSCEDYPIVKPGKKRLKRIYVGLLLFIFGRAFQAVAKVDPIAKREFENMPPGFMLNLCVAPNGPHMIVGKDKHGKIRYYGSNPKGKMITLSMKIKSLEAAMLMFTFQESSCTATARDRLIVEGDLPVASAVLRIMDLLEVLLLPKFIAKLGVKRYPNRQRMSLKRKLRSRILTYTRVVFG